MTAVSPSQTSTASIRVYVWQWPVRVAHWFIVLSLIALSVTGYYLYHPYVIPSRLGAFVMAKMRFSHELAGFTFMIAVLARIYWMFRGNKWARWNQFIPVSRARWRNLVETFKYYIFFRWRPAAAVGHNALAGATYTIVYALALVEIVTGLALFSHVLGSRFWTIVTGWPLRLMDVQHVREIHFLTMFAFWIFFIHHIYSSVLVDLEEKTGLVDSIFSGYKFVPEQQVREAEAPSAVLTVPPSAGAPN